MNHEDFGALLGAGNVYAIGSKINSVVMAMAARSVR
jgi:hypothetical protein